MIPSVLIAAAVVATSASSDAAATSLYASVTLDPNHPEYEFSVARGKPLDLVFPVRCTLARLADKKYFSVHHDEKNAPQVVTISSNAPESMLPLSRLLSVFCVEGVAVKITITAVEDRKGVGKLVRFTRDPELDMITEAALLEDRIAQKQRCEDLIVGREEELEERHDQLMETMRRSFEHELLNDVRASVSLERDGESARDTNVKVHVTRQLAIGSRHILIAVAENSSGGTFSLSGVTVTAEGGNIEIENVTYFPEPFVLEKGASGKLLVAFRASASAGTYTLTVGGQGGRHLEITDIDF